ncbi:MAG: OmpH family outer membrane protein [Mangrovibacterium sp.]
MKKGLLLLAVIFAFSFSYAQKYAYVDTDYILENIPAYTTAQSQLDKISQQYQKELEGMHAEIDKMYQNYQSESVLLSDDMRKKREDLIIAKEKEFKALQRQYFGPEGDLFQKREALVQPIQEDIFNAIQSIAVQSGYAVIFDKAASTNMLYTDSRYDLSDQVLQKLGYKN